MTVLDLLPLSAVTVDRVLALNTLHAEETSLLDGASLASLIAAAGYATAIGSNPDAFLIAFDECSQHDNANLAWFRERHQRFVYVDRVIVAPAARGRGLARALYRNLFARARADNRFVIGCEINVVPANPGSDALHASLGFAELAQRALGDGKVIRYMRCDLDHLPGHGTDLAAGSRPGLT